ncbi:MAG: hypothetical protein PHF86_01895 [Candidatus Nanoarchaeia archaeon]|nr:hypothetical protein [Candidatus Nanoarchaeia archaeon]
MAIKIKGTFLYFDRENGNRRIYKKEIAQSIIDQFNKKKESCDVYGSFGYPEDFDIPLGQVSHIVEEIHFNSEKNSLEGTIRILDTPKGNIVKDLLKENQLQSMSIRPRGIGNVNPSTKEIENFEIVSFDLIPSETDAFKQFKQNEGDEEKYFNC